MKIAAAALVLLGCQQPPPAKPAKPAAERQRAWSVSTDSDTFTGKISKSVTLISAENSAMIRLDCNNGRPYLGILSANGIFDYETDERMQTVTLQERRDDGAPVSHKWFVSRTNPEMAFWSAGYDDRAIRQLALLHKYVIQLNLYSKGYQTASFLEIPPQDVVTHWLASCSTQRN